MSTPHSPASSRVENLRIGPDGADFRLDGNPLQLSWKAHGPSVLALHGLYERALTDVPRAKLEARKGWLVRLREWFAHLIGPRARAVDAVESDAGTEKPASRAAAPSAAPSARSRGARPAAVVEAEPAEPPKRRAPAAPRAGPPSAPEPSTPREPADLPPPPGRGPMLRSAYADDVGVHLVWSVGEGTKSQQAEMLYAHDSEVGRRLQTCYERLSALGYPVVDLAAWSHAPKEGAPAPSADADSAAPAKPMPLPERPSAAAPEAKAAPPSFIMRLHPPNSDHPGRAVVSPIEDPGNLQVLIAPEKLVRALHAAADPGRPAPERLAFVRCQPGRTGLKVAAVGLGEEADGKSGAARWVDLDAWYAAAQKEAAPKPPAPVPAAEPELF